MQLETARAAIRQAIESAPQPARRFDAADRWLRALQREHMLLSHPPAWPLMSPGERAAIIDSRFKTGRHPRPDEPDPRTLVEARRGALWAGLLAQEPWAIRATGHLPARLLFSPRPPADPATLREQLIRGTAWAWCCEGWVITRHDLRP